MWAKQAQEVDWKKFLNLTAALTILGLLDDFSQVFHFLFAILHLLSIDFVEDCAEENKENLIFKGSTRFIVPKEKRHHLSSASSILGVDEVELHNSLVFQTFAAGQ